MVLQLSCGCDFKQGTEEAKRGNFLERIFPC